MKDARRESPAVARNREPLLAVLREKLPQAGLVLEIASGSGEHAVWFARHLPGLTWLPTDPNDEARASIAAWRAEAALPNLLPPQHLDAMKPETWRVDRADAMVAINMIHIAPWAATEGLMRGAGRVLAAGGLLVLYGPFRQNESAFAPGNAAFDLDLKARNPAWGIRELDAVAACAAGEALDLADVIPMPANNLSVIFRKV